MSDLHTLNSRKILIPKLDIILNFDTIELPDKGMFKRAKGKSIYQQLETDCINVVGATVNTIFTFEKWLNMTKIINSIFQNKNFNEEIVSVYGGKSEELKDKFEVWINDNKAYLNDNITKITSDSIFMKVIMRSIILNPFAKLQDTSIRFLDYIGEPSVLQSIYWELKEEGFTELEIVNWNVLTKSINNSIIPTSKAVYEDILSYQIPFAGSDYLKFISIENFEKACRGAALVMLTASAYGARDAMGDPEKILTLALYLSEGAFGALVFISIGSLEKNIESYLGKKGNREIVKKVVNKK